MDKMNLHYQEKEEWVHPDPVSEESEMKVIKITQEEWHSLYSALENYHCNETVFKKSNGNLVAFLYDNGNGKEPYKIIEVDK